MPEDKNQYGIFRSYSCSLLKEDFLKMLSNRIPDDGAVNISVLGPQLDQFAFKIYENHELEDLPENDINVARLKEGEEDPELV